MQEKKSTVDCRKATDKFIAYLSAKHLRKTPERFEILNSVLDCNGHFDADWLYNMLENKGYHVSRATIYNTIDLLCDSGIVRKLLFDTHQARYELAERTHSHLVCTKCGDIREINLDGIDSSLASMTFSGFSPAYVSTCIYGICDACNAKATGK